MWYLERILTTVLPAYLLDRGAGRARRRWFPEGKALPNPCSEEGEQKEEESVVKDEKTKNDEITAG